jgi:hypothetical protein
MRSVIDFRMKELGFSLAQLAEAMRMTESELRERYLGEPPDRPPR